MNRTIRYTRAYKGKDLGVARQYHAKYFEFVRKYRYFSMNYWSPFRPCGNFEANSDEKYMGFFRCRQYFEPVGFDYCCGVQGAHYCCPNASLATPYRTDPDTPNQNKDKTFNGFFVILYVTLIFFATTATIILCCRYLGCCKRARNHSNHQHTENSAGAAVSSSRSGTSDANSPQATDTTVSGFAYCNITFAPEVDAPPPYPGLEPPPSYQTVMAENESPPVPNNEET